MPDPGPKKPVLLLSPEFYDGETRTYVKADEVDAVVDGLRARMDDLCAGEEEHLTIDIVWMTDAEVEALPDV